MEIESEVDFVTLPPNYSDADRRRRQYLLGMLKLMHVQYREEAQPIVDELAEIESHYAPRIAVIPKAEGDTQGA